MSRSFDLLIIGTGAAAKSVAYPCRKAGRSVAVVDNRPFGGTCANRGCDPKKVLVGFSSALDAARRLGPHGLIAPGAHIDWPALMAFKRSFTDSVPDSTERSFRKAGIEMLRGTAAFVSSNAVEVAGERVEARHIVLCIGASPIPLGIPGEERLITSDDFLDLASLPADLHFVGGGYIAFEFAHLAARAGARVTIHHRGARPLEQFDPTLVAQLVDDTRALGIDLRLGQPVTEIPEDGATWIHAAGRAPNLKPLNLEAAGIAVTKRGIQVDQHLVTTNPAVYAAGDCADSGGPPLTPVAGVEGGVVATNLLNPGSKTVDYTGVASVVFTTPPLAAVGLTEAQAHGSDLDFEVTTGDSSSWYSSRRLAVRSSGYKILTERGTGRILGAHLYGEGADEHINLFALAIRAGLTAEIVQSTLFAYPTHGSDTQYML
ncbi:MAG: NAD(P)/FAD-dependent oxidoreductase [Bryobacteraceae bacterium]|nr:NAD(P)/FAD-dependent oxidoreductase [Bryobacteraceae bacterium]